MAGLITFFETVAILILAAVWWILTHLEADLIFVASTFLVVAFLLARHAGIVGGFWIFKLGTGTRSWKTCKRCAGMGVHMISGALIPRQYRNRYTVGQNSYIQANIANIVECSNCLGHGGYWVYEDGTRNDDIIPDIPWGGKYN